MEIHDNTKQEDTCILSNAPDSNSYKFVPSLPKKALDLLFT